MEQYAACARLDPVRYGGLGRAVVVIGEAKRLRPYQAETRIACTAEMLLGTFLEGYVRLLLQTGNLVVLVGVL